MKKRLLLISSMAFCATDALAAEPAATQTASMNTVTRASRPTPTPAASTRTVERISMVSAKAAVVTPIPTVRPVANATTNTKPVSAAAGASTDLPPPPPAPGDTLDLPGLQIVDGNTWDETAVRKVLFAFAYGGQTTDQQIKAWADMDPRQAIRQIMRWDQHNTQLSVPSPVDHDNLVNIPNTLAALSQHFAGLNQMPGERRRFFANNSWDRPRVTWTQSVVSRGLNPFRDRTIFWETNYHLAISMKTGLVTAPQAIRYYDAIAQAHADNLPYQDVLATAALSPAIARHYGHANSYYAAGICHCNEDFAREFYQLFFGVLGLSDKAYHEQVTIKNTAKALTDIRLINPSNPSEFWAGDQVAYGTQNHYPFPVEMHHQTLNFAAPDVQVNELAELNIKHPDSLRNLPAMIIRQLADDQLDGNELKSIRSAWQSMPEKNLLRFLRAYAISTAFHSPTRFKYQNSFDREITLANLMTKSNAEQYIDVPQMERLFWEQQEVAFSPDWAVFGGQTGQDAADNVGLFRSNYNANTGTDRYTRVDRNVYGQNHRLDWAGLIPPNAGGSYNVAATAAWLWQRFMADGQKNFGPLERAHLYALLATGQDLGTLVNPRNPDAELGLTEIQGPTVQTLVSSLGEKPVLLDSKVASDRYFANERVGQAVAFIATNPYVFAQEGR